MIFESSLSPTRDRIAFVFGVPGGGISPGNMSLYVMSTRGTDIRKISSCPKHRTCDTAYGSGISWSPDGAKIALAGEGSIYVIDPDVGGLKQLAGCPSCRASHPAWSPNGSSIAFSQSDGILSG